MRFLLRLLINAAALWVAVRIVPGLHYTGDFGPLLLVALIFGLLNAFIRPALKILTLGLFALLINAFMLWLTGRLAGSFGIPFQVDGCLAAIFGSIVVSLVSAILSMVLPEPD